VPGLLQLCYAMYPNVSVCGDNRKKEGCLGLTRTLAHHSSLCGTHRVTHVECITGILFTIGMLAIAGA
jgi:hypothetical protein